MEDYEILYHLDADEVIEHDQIIIDGDLCIVLGIDDDREDPDEIRFRVENLSTVGVDTFDVQFDDNFAVWSI